MRYSLSTLALTALASSCACVSALGINCWGRNSCSRFKNPDNPGQSIADSLRQEIHANVNLTRWYQNGEHIVCVDGEIVEEGFVLYRSICAFLQKTGGIPGNEIKMLADRIVENNCRICGSVPVYYERVNDVEIHGELTFDLVVRNIHEDGSCRSIKGKCSYE